MAALMKPRPRRKPFSPTDLALEVARKIRPRRWRLYEPAAGRGERRKAFTAPLFEPVISRIVGGWEVPPKNVIAIEAGSATAWARGTSEGGMYHPRQRRLVRLRCAADVRDSMAGRPGRLVLSLGH
jgi:hypothetical protein